MMHNTQALYGALNDQLHTINEQIEAVKKRAQKQIDDFPWATEAMTVFDVQDTTGKNVLTDLLVAKAQVLSGMAALKAADLSSKAPVSRERRR
jgi:hypothetical protein